MQPGLASSAPVLWRQREQTGRSFNVSIIWTFILALVLHALWNIAGTTQISIIIFTGYLIIGGISLTLLIWRLREAKRYAVLKK